MCNIFCGKRIFKTGTSTTENDSCLATGWEKLRSPLPAFPGGGPGGGPARLRVGAVGLQAVFLILVLARGESGGLELPAALLMATYLSMTNFIRA